MKTICPPLSPDQLYKSCDPSEFNFESTEELADTGVIFGQERALNAIQFSIAIEQKGYNLFVLGPSGTGKLTAIKEIVAREAEKMPPPDDWCYITQHGHPSKPKTLRLEAGLGKRFADDMDQLIDELSTAIPAAFEGEEYRGRAEEIEENTKIREANAINELRIEAKKQLISLIETPTGFALAPLDENNEIYSPERFSALPEDKQTKIQDKITRLHLQMQKLLRQFPIWRKEAKEKLKALNREIATYSVNHSIDELRTRHTHHLPILNFLQETEQDIIDHTEDFFPRSEAAAAILDRFSHGTSPLMRCKINLMVDHSKSSAAPVLVEDFPSLSNLIGRIEYQSYMGALVTDFTMIKPGALHKANGGFLIIDARKLLLQPFAWEGLKRTLLAGEIRIESLERSLGLVSTVSLEPEPIPIKLKIILFGDRMLYYLLSLYDPEFSDLFKVSADFEDSMDRDPDSSAIYSRVIASLARRENLLALNKEAVIRIIEHSARCIEDSEKLSTHLRSLNDLLKEADYWAKQSNRKRITKEDVQTAIDQQVHRSDRLRNRIYESIQRGTLFVETQGETIGQVNGLSVISLSDFSFGMPARITATTRLGTGKVIDIERESELGGPIHSKGVMILSSFLASRYAKTNPFSVSITLVFEQSYGSVEGDSASVAELCAILSSLAELPIKQNLAITGSMSQHGKAQPIGGVNEKIEGFFDVCDLLGLTGDQGVIIPKSNIKNLMLRQNVVDAVKSGKFQIFAIENVDEALELLLGRPMGEPDASGQFPADSINARVVNRLKQLEDIQSKLIGQNKEDHSQDKKHLLESKNIKP